MIIVREFPFDYEFELNLLESYIQDVEKQISFSINNFKEKEIIDEISEGNIVQSTEYIYNLSSGDYNLEYIGTEYFPTLQRKSAFITLYSFMESLLNRFCLKIQKIKNLNIGFKDLAGDN